MGGHESRTRHTVACRTTDQGNVAGAPTAMVTEHTREELPEDYPDQGRPRRPTTGLAHPGRAQNPTRAWEPPGGVGDAPRDTTRNLNGHGGGRHRWIDHRGTWRISQVTTSPGPSRLLTERQPRAARLFVLAVSEVPGPSRQLTEWQPLTARPIVLAGHPALPQHGS